MQLVKLHHIDAKLHTDGWLQGKRTIVFERKQLDSHTFMLIEGGFLELFQQQLGVGFHQTVRTNGPSLALGAEVGVIQIIITVVHQIGFKGSGTYSLDVLGHESQVNIEHIAPFHLGLAVHRYLRFGQRGSLHR